MSRPEDVSNPVAELPDLVDRPRLGPIDHDADGIVEPVAGAPDDPLEPTGPSIQHRDRVALRVGDDEDGAVDREGVGLAQRDVPSVEQPDLGSRGRGELAHRVGPVRDEEVAAA